MSNQELPEQIAPVVSDEPRQNNYVYMSASIGTTERTLPKKTLTVVYSFDSISSIVAAGLLKGITSTCDKSGLLDVKFVEVGALNVTKMSEYYIWLGVEPVSECAVKEIRSKFTKHSHIVINDDSLWEFPKTKLINDIGQKAEEHNLAIKTITSSDAIRYSRQPESSIYFGMLLSSVNALVHLFPALSYEDVASEIFTISKLQKRCAQFYDKTTPIHQVLQTYMFVNNMLVDLGQPGTIIAPDIEIDQLSTLYKTRYDQVAKQITNQVVVRDVLLTKQVWKDRAPYKGNSGVRVPVICTFLSHDFWLARRIIAFGQKFYHNTRLVSYGKHQTTNLLQSSVADMAGQSDNAIIINKS